MPFIIGTIFKVETYRARPGMHPDCKKPATSVLMSCAKASKHSSYARRFPEDDCQGIDLLRALRGILDTFASAPLPSWSSPGGDLVRANGDLGCNDYKVVWRPSQLLIEKNKKVEDDDKKEDEVVAALIPRSITREVADSGRRIQVDFGCFGTVELKDHTKTPQASSSQLAVEKLNAWTRMLVDDMETIRGTIIVSSTEHPPLHRRGVLWPDGWLIFEDVQVRFFERNLDEDV